MASGLFYAYQILDRDIILGGVLAHYLSDEDIVRLEELIIKQAPFLISRGFIHKAPVEKNAALNGAGLFFMRHYRE